MSKKTINDIKNIIKGPNIKEVVEDNGRRNASRRC